MRKSLVVTSIGVGVFSSAVLFAEVVPHANTISFSASSPASRFAACESSWNRPVDCPNRVRIRGFNVWVAPHMRKVLNDRYDAAQNDGSLGNWFIHPNRVVEVYLERLDAALLSLETRWDVRGHFIERLRMSSVSFFLSPEVGPGEGFLFTRCPPHSGCYNPTDRMVEDSIEHPGNIGSVLHFVAHELAHAYHDIVIRDGFDNLCIKEAYRLSVGRDGLHEATYAATNEREYFAQMFFYALQPTNGLNIFPERLLANYDGNAAGLMTTFLVPLHGTSPHRDPYLTPLVGERERECDPAEFWPK